MGGSRLWTELLFGRRLSRDQVFCGAVPAASIAAASIATIAAALAAAGAALAATSPAAALAAALAANSSSTAALAALAAAVDRLLGNHLLQRLASKRSWLEPQLLRWHHAQRRRAIHRERAVGCGARRSMHSGYDSLVPLGRLEWG